jgi:hypothetical protein
MFLGEIIWHIWQFLQKMLKLKLSKYQFKVKWNRNLIKKHYNTNTYRFVYFSGQILYQQRWLALCIVHCTVFALSHMPKAGTSKTGFGQVKIMKEFNWINIIFFLNLAFKQAGEKK